MPRVRPADRFDRLVRTAATTFIAAGGFHKTQIVDIAKALGVAKGTVYLLADSKEALFEAALEHADSTTTIATPSELPITSKRGEYAESILRKRLDRESRFPRLEAAIASAVEPADLRREVSGILEELYDVLKRNRVTIKLLTVTAAELPELASAWFEEGRGRLLALVQAYLEARRDHPQSRPRPTPEISARLVLETTSWFAVHRHFDPAPQPIDDDAARTEVVRVVSCGLVRDAARC